MLAFAYAFLFIIPSVLGFLFCLIVPRFRHRALYVLVCPVAFGVFSIVVPAVLAFVDDWVSNRLKLADVDIFSSPGVVALIYVGGGCIGWWIAREMLAALTGWFRSKNSGRPITDNPN